MKENYHKAILCVFYFLGIINSSEAQFVNSKKGLPKGLTPYEKSILPTYQFGLDVNEPTYAITDPPEFPVRTMAEWEEIQSLVIARASHFDVLHQIIIHASKEVEVIEVVDKGYKTNNNVFQSKYNTTVVNAPINSVWIRDYGANTIYKDDVEDLLLVDWIYNRPRPDDDKVPEAIAKEKKLSLYATTADDTKLVHTGGNFMVDGLGTAFASKLILDENSKTEKEIDEILKNFMGIERFIKMDVLPYDGIHHIDMHMKLLDEETLLVGKYPDNIADGPQIEANIQYVLNNYKSVWGTPYRIVRIPMPSDNGTYPDKGGDYRTYTNCTFVNGTLLVPVYGIDEDEQALSILRDNLPGYNVVGINCDNIIIASGAIHCVTKAIGSNDPLLINHQRLRDNAKLIDRGYKVEAQIRHKTGIGQARIFYTEDTTKAYESVPMENLNDENWEGYIPNISTTGVYYYYIEAESKSGKKQVRPLVAPKGYWKFKIEPLGRDEDIRLEPLSFGDIFPNPAGAITCIPLTFNKSTSGSIKLLDVSGREKELIYSGDFPQGEKKFFFNAANYASGVYNIVVSTKSTIFNKTVVIK